MSQAIGLADLTLEYFEPLVGESFEVSFPELVERLVLTSVDRQAFGEGERRNRIPFTLNFEGTTPGVLLHQQIHALVHPAIGTQEIFLVPVACDPGGVHSYEAAFA